MNRSVRILLAAALVIVAISLAANAAFLMYVAVETVNPEDSGEKDEQHYALIGEDFTVTGETEGSFERDGERGLRIELDGVAYSGFYAVGYDADQDAFVTTFTAMSADGQTLWGIRATGQD